MFVADSIPAHDTTDRSKEHVGVMSRPADRVIHSEASYAHYMQDVRRYLTHVKSDRVQFRQLDVHHPRFAQNRDEGLPFRNPRPVHRLEHECGPTQRDTFFTVLNWFRGRSHPWSS